MDNDILDPTDDNQPGAGAKPNGDATPPPNKPAEAKDDGQWRADIEKVVGTLGGQVQQLVGTLNTLASQPPPAAPAPPPPKVDPNDRLNELAADPDQFVKTLTREQVEQYVTDNVNPAVMSSLEAANQIIIAQRAAQDDAKFGPGTFQELFREQLDKDMAQLRQANPRALADPAVINNLVDRLYGPNFTKLQERLQETQKTMAQQREEGIREIVSHIPSGGIPRLRAPSGDDPGELPDDVKSFINDVDSKTGGRTDQKTFTKLYHSGVESGPGRHRTSIQDYLDATAADPEVKKQYGVS